MNPDASQPKPINWPSIEGSPHPLGVTYIAEEDSYNFALYSQNAREVTLLFYSADDWRQPILEVQLDPLSHKTKRVWHYRLPRQQLALAQARYYAYRINGPAPHGPNQWHAQFWASSTVTITPCCKSCREAKKLAKRMIKEEKTRKWL